jgi:hypothetical protein
MRLNMSNPVSKLVFAHTHGYNPVTETVDDGWRRVVVRIQLRIVSIHNLSAARVSDEIDKARDLGLLLSRNGVLGNIVDGGALGCSEFTCVVYVALSSVFDDSSVLCGEHARMGIGGGRVLYVHTLYSYDETTCIR